MTAIAACRALLTQEGICLTLSPEFHFLEVAYPYVARRLLTAEDPILRERLFQVSCFAVLLLHSHVADTLGLRHMLYTHLAHSCNAHMSETHVRHTCLTDTLDAHAQHTCLIHASQQCCLHVTCAGTRNLISLGLSPVYRAECGEVSCGGGSPWPQGVGGG